MWFYQQTIGQYQADVKLWEPCVVLPTGHWTISGRCNTMRALCVSTNRPLDNIRQMQYYESLVCFYQQAIGQYQADVKLWEPCVVLPTGHWTISGRCKTMRALCGSTNRPLDNIRQMQYYESLVCFTCHWPISGRCNTMRALCVSTNRPLANIRQM